MSYERSPIGSDRVPLRTRTATASEDWALWRDKLDQLLLANGVRASRERLTLIQLIEELHGFGYDAGYDAVRRYARGWI